MDSHDILALVAFAAVAITVSGVGLLLVFVALKHKARSDRERNLQWAQAAARAFGAQVDPETGTVRLSVDGRVVEVAWSTEGSNTRHTRRIDITRLRTPLPFSLDLGLHLSQVPVHALAVHHSSSLRYYGYRGAQTGHPLLTEHFIVQRTRRPTETQALLTHPIVIAALEEAVRVQDTLTIELDDVMVRAKLIGVHTERRTIELAAVVIGRVASALAEAAIELRQSSA